MTAFVVRNHNGVLIGWDSDLGNIMEEAMVYEEMTGNTVTIDKEIFEETPQKNRP
jgi:hypothetical protein